MRRYLAPSSLPGRDSDFSRERITSSQNTTSARKTDDSSASSVQSAYSSSIPTDPNRKYVDELRQMRSKELAETMFLSGS